MNSTPPSFSGGDALPPTNGHVAVDSRPAESTLDRLPRLASGLLRAPVALVVLLQGGLLRLVRGVGLPDDCVRELPASHPFWTRILGTGESAALEDAGEEAPLGGRLGLAAWLGVPLSPPDVDGRGCLCVAAPHPRVWSGEETAPLRDLAAVSAAGMEPNMQPEGRRSEEADILDSIPHACFALDHQWRFTYLSPRAQQLFGQMSRHSGVQLLGRNIWDECPEVADSTFARECQQVRAEQKPLEAETYYPGIGRWFAVHVSPVPGDGVSVFLQDVNERLGLARALGQSTEQLAEADRGKEEFLVQLAHEVRNALAPVRNALHLTQSRGLDDPEDEQACALAEQEIQRLSRLMDNLLKVSQLIPGNVRLEKKQVNLSALVARALTGMLTSAAAGGRSVTVSLPPEPVWIDAGQEQLEQAFQHLLDNAAKFTRPGGHIRLTVERDARAAVLRVWDDGVGMRTDVLPRVFNLFMRGDRGAAHFQGGVGIGLTLVRHLVELHGGTVEARSEGPGRGSEFIVRLPAPPGPPTDPSWQKAGAGDGERPLRVLVVDDSMDNAQSLCLILGRWGYEVHVAYDGPQALEAAACRPDVVLLDIGMPGMSGYEVAKRLRQREGAEKMVLVAVSGYGEDEVRRGAREAGFDHHLVKPLNPADLKDMLIAADSTLRQKRCSSAE